MSTPRNLKNQRFSTVWNCVSEILFPASGSPKPPQNETKLVPPKWPRRPPEISRVKATLDLSLNFHTFWSDVGTPNRTPKIAQNLSWAPPPQRPPRGLWGAILEPFGTKFGATLEPMLERFGNPVWNAFSNPSPRHSCHICVPASLGRWVSALALTMS